jgi:hypothetical protein
MYRGRSKACNDSAARERANELKKEREIEWKREKEKE